MSHETQSIVFLGLALATVAFCLGSAAQDFKAVKLPPPQTDGGRPLMQVFKDRKSTREFGPGTLSPQTLSNLLWAAFGINRPDGHRTAPSAMNWQEVSIYVATPDGVYIYDAKNNALNPLLAGDFRAATGTQSYVKDAAVNLLYVSEPFQNRQRCIFRGGNVYRRGRGIHRAERLSILRLRGACSRCAGQHR